jgi:hypothetical protein
MTQRWHPLTDAEAAKIEYVAVTDARYFTPWSPQVIDMVHYRTKKTYISLTDCDDEGNPDWSTQTVYRLRALSEDGKLGILRREDDEEPDEPPHWREGQ